MREQPEVKLWFPTCTYRFSNLMSDSENEEICDRILGLSKCINTGGDNWNCNTLTSLGTYDLEEDDTFKKLNNRVFYHVNNFARFYNSQHDYQLRESWFNIALENNYQEPHVHPNSVFSCVYYASVPEGSGDLVFFSPENEMIQLLEVDEYNQYSSQTFSFQPMKGDLIIFRSHVRHMVKPNHSQEPRISLSYNFA